ncbi:type VI secretion protein ImpB [Fretibacter rubidus]|uniref:Y-family DNA polymerase n=1 Tax=Fretibacter rubidus TaxID=570162 RepID=UPI00352A4966
MLQSLYIDFDAFFANVERQLHPDIRGRPVGVTALDSDYSAFITRCYRAKAFGIKRGMRVRDARAMCPDLVVRVAQPDVYVDIHNRILDEIDRHVPVTKVWSIDEMECTLIGSEQERASDIAAAIRAGLAKNIGPYITPSIGLAPNQFLAKVAAEMDKPNGMVTLASEDLPGPLLSLTLSDLPGISGNMERRLHRAGVMTVQDFWNISAKHARAIWGNIEGERMWAQLHGLPVIRPPTEKRMFGHSRVLTKGWRTADKAIKCLELLTVKAAYRLRRADYLCSAMSVSFKLADGTRYSGETDFGACQDDPTLLRYMHGLFDRGVAALPPQAALKSVYVMLHKISKPYETNGDLFEHADADQGRSVKWNKAMAAMDGLNVRHGRAVVCVGSRADLPGGYAGGKIAFGRVPDKEDFY